MYVARDDTIHGIFVWLGMNERDVGDKGKFLVQALRTQVQVRTVIAARAAVVQTPRLVRVGLRGLEEEQEGK
jgi:hypothetical protein